VKEPSGHSAHDEAPSKDVNVPLLHGSHAATLLAPGDALNVPARHGTQPAPSAETYEPATQTAHVLDPTGAAEPTAHGRHADASSAPSWLTNVPAMHCRHAESCASAYEPALHCTHDVDSASDTKPLAQSEHDEEPSGAPV
jgi:hypothetical protein